MKKLRHTLSILFVVSALFSLSSCLDDDWFDDDWWENGGWNDDRRVESVIRGRWSLDYVDIAYGDCPYYEFDEFNFYSNGRLEIFGDNDFYERGRWYVDDRRVVVDFDGDKRADLIGYIDELYRGFMSMEVRDYMANSKYYLELVR